MALSKFTEDMAIIQKLDDEPNDVGGLTSAELKERFDRGGTKLQEYLNNTLLPQLEALGILEVLRTKDPRIKYLRLNAGGSIEVSADGLTWAETASSGHIIQDAEGKELPQRPRLRFLDGVVRDDGACTVIQGLKGDQGEPGERGPQGIQGEPGRDGSTGPAGDQGPRGPQGIQGPQGPRGPQGEQGPQGERGTDGNSFVIRDVFATLDALRTEFPQGNNYAYQVLDQGGEIFIWSERQSDWVSVGALQGPPGPQGIRGPQGIQGPKGEAGAEGPKGDTGAEGPQGIQGPAGPAGPSGSPGADGKSAYAAAVEGGYSGTEAAFNQGLSKAVYAIPQTEKGTANGVASLDSTGRLPVVQMPAGFSEAPCFVRMASVDLSASQSTIVLDLKNYDLRQFRELQLICAPVVAEGSYTGSLSGPLYRLAMNDSSNWTALHRIKADASVRQGLTTHLILAPTGPCLYTLTSTGGINAPNPSDTVDYGDALSLTLGLSDNAIFGAGTWISVYGLKK